MRSPLFLLFRTLVRIETGSTLFSQEGLALFFFFYEEMFCPLSEPPASDQG